MIYGNIFLEKKFPTNLFKKNNKKKTEQKKPIVFTDEEKGIIEDILKHIVDKYNKNKDIKNQIDKKLKKFNDENNDNIKFTKFVCELFEDNDTEIIFIVCDDDQMTRDIINDYTYDIGKELEKQLKKKNIDVFIDIGDGDEGCLYITNKKER